MKLCTLGSGSRGNSFVITNNSGNTILVDAGFSCKKLLEKLSLNQIDIDSIKAVLITHDHEDHISGCRVFCNKLNIPLYATFSTSEAMSIAGKLPKNVIQFEAGETFNIDDFSISAFAVQHDATDPVGFTINCDDKKLGIATDLGILDMLCKKHLTNCHGLVLECNYDVEMLFNSARSLHLKRRINSNSGHMSNEQTMEALNELLGELSQLLMLVHLSGECNSRKIVENLLENHLILSSRGDILTYITSQEEVSNWFTL